MKPRVALSKPHAALKLTVRIKFQPSVRHRHRKHKRKPRPIVVTRTLSVPKT